MDTIIDSVGRYLWFSEVNILVSSSGVFHLGWQVLTSIANKYCDVAQVPRIHRGEESL